MEKNIKLFPYYRLFSCDVLFFYAVSTLYYIEMKNFTIAQVGLLTAFYSLFSIFTQIPASIISDKIGLKKTMLIGNILLIIYCIGILILPNFYSLVPFEFIKSLAFALKGCSETPFLFYSLKKLGKTNKQSKIESKSDSFYYIIEGVSCVITGYLYKMNSYLPIIFSILCFVISSFICYLFKPIPRYNKLHSKNEYFNELKTGFKFIFKSNRLRALLIFSFTFVGIISVATFLLKSYLTDLNASSQVFGYIYAGMALFSTIGALLQRRIELKLRNKTLTIIALIFIITIIFTGVFLFVPLNTSTLIILGAGFFLFQAFLKGSYWITMRIYLSRYTTNVIRPKIMSIYNLMRNAGSFILLLIVTSMVDAISLPLCFILIGTMFFITIIIIAAYMDTRVGLNPSHYTAKDRHDLAVKEYIKDN